MKFASIVTLLLAGGLLWAASGSSRAENLTIESGKRGYFVIQYKGQPIFVNRVGRGDESDAPSPIFVAKQPDWMPVHRLGDKVPVEVNEANEFGGKSVTITESAEGGAKVEIRVRVEERKAMMEFRVNVPPQNRWGATIVNFEFSLPKDAYFDSVVKDDGIGYPLKNLDSGWLEGKWAETLGKMNQREDDVRYNFKKVSFTKSEGSYEITFDGMDDPNAKRNWRLSCDTAGVMRLYNAFQFPLDQGLNDRLTITLTVPE